MDTENQLRKELLSYLEKGSAHASLDEAIKNFPKELMNDKPENIPYTFWALLEHIRITQFDMVDFIYNPNYKELEWPKDYWSKPEIKATPQMWEETIKSYKQDLEKLKSIVENDKNDLFTPIPHGQGQTILKEVLQIIDHAAYHTGEFVLMRRLLGVWKK